MVRTSAEEFAPLVRDLGDTLGWRPTYMSKRLAPPMAVCNARLVLGNSCVWEGDLDIYKHRHTVAEVAKAHGVVLTLLPERSPKGDVYWTSDEPDVWKCPHLPGGFDSPQDFDTMFPAYKELADEQHRRWSEDHGFTG